MKKTAVLIVVGLTPDMLGRDMPALSTWAKARRVSSIIPPLPAVTCSSQATYYTGQLPTQHGIVANGWYYRDDCEIHLWRQSNKLVQAPKIWDAARQLDPSFTCANLFGWYNMYSSVDYSITPRPMYPADGRKVPTFILTLAICATPCKPNSGHSRCSNFGGRGLRSTPQSGLPNRPNSWTNGTRRR